MGDARPRRRSVPAYACAFVAAAALAAAGLAPGRDAKRALAPSDETVLLVAGDVSGYLAPCGCTEPMTGGIRRMASAIREYRGAGTSALLVNGGLVQTNPPNGRVGRRQNELKAETLVEAYAALRADAINVDDSAASGGAGLLLELGQLADGRMVATELAAGDADPFPAWRAAGPYLLGTALARPDELGQALGTAALGPVEAAAKLCREAKRRGKRPVLLLRGGIELARAVARAQPELALVVYASAGTAPDSPQREGGTILVTPGDRAKNLVRLEFRGAALVDFRVATLTPAYADDKRIGKFYAEYLRRLDKANLIAGLPRSATGAFAGVAACGKCHAEALAVWRASAHAHALLDLERRGHAKDPDCLGCHVTGLDSLRGFRSRAATPRFADVGCEACHGPGAAHAAHPRAVALPKLDPDACLKCHTPDNSPRFDFERYWKRIRHR